MSPDVFKKYAIGWVGTGRMGFPMAQRLLKAGCDVAVYNRTRDKAAPLREYGATVVDTPADLAGRDVVFTMVAASDDFRRVTIGPDGVLSRPGKVPKILVDCTTVSEEASAEVRVAAARLGVQMLAAPVSGNGKVVKAGKLSIVASGPRDAYEAVEPLLAALGTGSTYVGDGDLSRLMKICHNVFLGVVIQSLCEITILAQKAGVPRHAFLDFMNKSVMGSTFSKYKTPALVNLDFKVTFTPQLLRKDMDLGLDAGRKYEVPMPLASATRDLIQSMIGQGWTEQDFATLVLQQAEASGLKLKPENVEVGDGLS